MSIYSGFATRALELTYNKYLGTLISMLNSHLIALLKNQPFDPSTWAHSYSRTIRSLKKLQRKKHLEPKFSCFTNDISEYYQKQLKFEQTVPSNNIDLQILDNGLAYDDSRVPRPVKTRYFEHSYASLKQTQPAIKTRSSSQRQCYSSVGFRPVSRGSGRPQSRASPLKNSRADLYQDRALSRLGMKFSCE